MLWSLQTERRAQMAGGGGGGLSGGRGEGEAWICMCGPISLRPPPPLHGKTRERGAGSVGGGSDSDD